jgi:hypothetical protein
MQHKQLGSLSISWTVTGCRIDKALLRIRCLPAYSGHRLATDFALPKSADYVYILYSRRYITSLHIICRMIAGHYALLC